VHRLPPTAESMHDGRRDVTAQPDRCGPVRGLALGYGSLTPDAADFGARVLGQAALALRSA